MTNLHDARVEAACKAYQAAQNADPYDFKGRMSAALAAADAVVTVAMIAKVLADHRYSSMLGMCACENDYDDSFDEAASHAAHQARVVLALLRGGDGSE